MGNRITCCGNPEFELSLSNGGTTVLFSCLVLSGGDLAKTTWEKQLLTWLATKDQTVVGVGSVGFDLADLAWTQESFTDQRAFLLKIIDHALDGPVWERLSDDPPHARTCLEQLRKLVNAVKVFEMVQRDTRRKGWWWPKESELHDRCKKHGAYPSAYGLCLVCNHEASLIS